MPVQHNESMQEKRWPAEAEYEESHGKSDQSHTEPRSNERIPGAGSVGGQSPLPSMGDYRMTGGARSRSLELFFVYGQPDGLTIAKEFNWTGHVLMTPRTQLKAALQRNESSYTGIYLLIGEKEGKPLAYIGEADKVGDRIRNHDVKKDWWTSAILITSADNNLNKAHVKYLEAKLISLAETVRKITLYNGTIPPIPNLTEPEKAKMEVFLENILMILPVLKIDSFVDDVRPGTFFNSDRNTTDDPKQSAASDQPFFELGRARARQIDDKFVVEKGAVAAMEWTPQEWERKKGPSSYQRLFKQLIDNGILQKEKVGEHRVFSENYAFDSASAAASVVKGTPRSGPNDWKVQGQQKTLKQWEEDRLAGLEKRT